MRDYEYKVVVEIDDDNEDEYDFDYICNVIRSCFIDEGMRDVSEGNRLVFITHEGNRNSFGAVGMTVNALYGSWLRPYIKAMEWHDKNGGSVDILKSCKRLEEKIAAKAHDISMGDYEFKLVIRVDDEKIKNENKYDLDDTYKIIREVCVERGMTDISSARELVFVTMMGDAHGYSAVGLSINAIYDSWLRPYIKKMKWYEDDGSVEDVLESFSRFDERN